ncbi:MAG: metal-sensing transcriptional repressor [Thalassobaculales bacterium]
MHQSHLDIAKRLKRAEGHIRSVIAMMEAGRPCLDLAQQLHAVERAVASAKKDLIRDHIEHCLDGMATEGPRDARTALKEMRALSKYL